MAALRPWRSLNGPTVNSRNLPFICEATGRAPKGSGTDDGDGGGRNAPSDFRGQKRSNDTHESATDPDAMLYRKGPSMEAKLCFIGHGLPE